MVKDSFIETMNPELFVWVFFLLFKYDHIITFEGKNKTLKVCEVLKERKKPLIILYVNELLTF